MIDENLRKDIFNVIHAANDSYHKDELTEPQLMVRINGALGLVRGIKIENEKLILTTKCDKDNLGGIDIIYFGDIIDENLVDEIWAVDSGAKIKITQVAWDVLGENEDDEGYNFVVLSGE